MPEIYIDAERKFESLVRQYMDEWISTGLGFTPGEEFPRRRNIEALMAQGHPGGRRNAAQAARYYLNANPPTAQLLRDGGLHLVFPLESFRLDGNDNPLVDAEEEAVRLFAAFLVSDLRFNIAKCQNSDCGVYYLRKKPRSLYKRRTYCLSCRSKQTAMSRTRDKRMKAARKLYDLAARKFGSQITDNPEWKKDLRLKHKIAAHLDRMVNQGKSCVPGVTLKAIYPNGIKVNWVSLNKNASEIQRAVKELKRATR